MQFFIVLFSPAVFGTAFYNGMKNAHKYSPAWDWGDSKAILLNDSGSVYINGSAIVVFFYLLFYVAWSYMAYKAPGGRIREEICVCAVIVGVLAVIPVYYTLLASAFVDFGPVHYIILFGLLGPIFIASAQSSVSAMLYVCYLPWFLLMAVFFLVFIPSYSFVRLWDTTWGNRFTERDENIDQKRETDMITYTLRFACTVIVLNIFLTGIFSLYLSPTAQLVFMLIIFLPSTLQIFGSILFLFIIVPSRACLSNRTMDEEAVVAENQLNNKRLDEEEAAKKSTQQSKSVSAKFELNLFAR